MKQIISHPNTEASKLTISKDRKKRLGEELNQEIMDAISAKQPMEQLFRELLRQYEGVPKRQQRDVPIVNGPNIEITLGAVTVDSVFAQVLDLVYNITPAITIRSVGPENVEAAKALQRFVNWLVANEAEVRRGTENAFLDNVQLGTGIYFVPWIEKVTKTAVRQIKAAGPVIRAIPPEDFLIPGGATDDLQMARWVAMRMLLTHGELQDRADLRGWDIGAVQPINDVSWVRSRREQLARTTTSTPSNKVKLYEVWDIYIYYDIDGDGVLEDLLVTWDRQSRSILRISYNPYDRRPFESMRYQLRPHIFYGIGVLEMLRPFQEGATELYNHWLINLMIANARVWKAKEGIVPNTMELWPNKVIPLPNPSEDLIPEQMGDVYQSAPQALATTMSFAERRTGVNDLSLPRPSQVLGSRTPGITALSMIQQVNKRFTPAFDSMRLATGAAVKQCLYRYQERLLAGDTLVQDKIVNILGLDDGFAVVQLLSDPEFDDNYEVELTASSASVNKDQDKQNAIMLATQILAPYYQRSIELAMLASNPQLPEEVRSVVSKVAAAMTEGVDMIMRTFDQVRDPSAFVISIMGELQASQQAAPERAQAQSLEGMLGAALGGGQPGGGQTTPQ